MRGVVGGETVSVAGAVLQIIPSITINDPTITGNPYYVGLPYSRVLSQSLGELCDGFSWGGCDEW